MGGISGVANQSEEGQDPEEEECYPIWLHNVFIFEEMLW
jgi:hypothetical protein